MIVLGLLGEHAVLWEAGREGDKKWMGMLGL